MRKLCFFTFAVALTTTTVFAQNAETLADIRQQLTVLNVEMKKLKRELSTTGGVSVNVAGTTVLERVNAMESELQRMTSKTEELEFRINQIVDDGTRRIGDLEFRLVELEGGDVSTLGQTSTLGGESQITAPPVAQPTGNGVQLAVGEKADFERAKTALSQGNYRAAADQFAAFNSAYPGGPLAAEADLRRGEALAGLGDIREAARAYLASFGAAPTGPLAPEALFHLGRSLGQLGQINEACVTLGEVGVRFPQSPMVSRAAQERQRMGCS